MINNSDQGNLPGLILFSNATCNSAHSNLFQCFDLQNIGIGIHNCQHNEVAGVSCQQSAEKITATSIVLTTSKIISNGIAFTNTTSDINNSTEPSTVTVTGTDVEDLIHDVTNLYVSNTESAVISTAASLLLLLAVVVAIVSMAFVVRGKKRDGKTQAIITS